METEKGRFWKGFATGLLTMMAVLLVVVFVTQGTGVVNWIGAFNGKNNVISAKTEAKLEEIEGKIDEYYLDDIDQEQMEDSIAKGLADGLGDKYAAYYTKEEYKTIQERNAGNFCGIGASVSQSVTSGAITVVQPIKDSPAEKAGIQSGDIIYAVDDEVVTEMDLSEVVSKMKGEKGTKVKVTVYRDGEPDYLDFEVIRDNIETATVSYQMLDNEIGYIAVTGFEEVTTEQFQDAVDALEKKGEKALVIDLRDNGGGLMQTAIDMLNYLIPDGKLVYTMNKNGVEKEYDADNKHSLDIPMAVLVNGNSASASEIFSGALQDYGKAKLVGTTTYGKGIVQTLMMLSDGTGLKLTTAKYYTPKGRNIHGTGLEPDVQVEKTDVVTKQKKSGISIDNQLEKAIEILGDEI